MDAGSADRLAQQNLRIPEHANDRTLPSWIFDASLPVRDWLTTSRPVAILVTPIPIKSRPPSTPHLQRQNFLASVEVRLKRLISTAVEMRLKKSMVKRTCG